MKINKYSHHCFTCFTRTSAGLRAVTATVFLLCGSIATAQAQPLAVNSVTFKSSGQTVRIPSSQQVNIKKPTHVKGQPASESLPQATPEFGDLEELESWLLDKRRATWRYFDKLDIERKERILDQYQKYPDTDLLSENVLRTYWKFRSRVASAANY